MATPAATRKGVKKGAKPSVRRKRTKSTKTASKNGGKPSGVQPGGSSGGAPPVVNGTAKPPMVDLFGAPIYATIGQLKQKAQFNPNSLTLQELKQLRELQKLQPPKDAEDVSMMLAAELLGCTERNVKELRSSHKISKGMAEGRLDLRSICTYLREYRDKRLKAEMAPDDDTLEYYKREYKRLQTELMEITLERERSGLTDTRELRSQFREAGNRVRTAFEGLGREYGPDVADAIREVIDEACKELGMEVGN